jgi:hypothetical protein
VEIQKKNRAESLSRENAPSDPDLITGIKGQDPFAIFEPSQPFEWDPKVQKLFDFCRQDSAKTAASSHVASLKNPTNLQLPCPLLDRSATKQFKEAVKGQDKLKKSQALAAINLDSKIMAYQHSTVDLMKLVYESSRLMAGEEVSKTDLLKVNSSVISLLYSMNSKFIHDRRESIAFFIDGDIELARSLPLPAPDEFLFGKVYIETAETEEKKDKVFSRKKPDTTSETGAANKQENPTRYRPYHNQHRYNRDQPGSSKGNQRNRQIWPKNNAIPRQTGKHTVSNQSISKGTQTESLASVPGILGTEPKCKGTSKELLATGVTQSTPLDANTLQILKLQIRDSTRAIYDCCWRRWIQYTNRLKISSSEPSIQEFCNFLAHLKSDKNFAYNTLIGYRAALLGRFKVNFTTAELSLLRKLFSGFKNLSPPTPKYKSIWSLDKVLSKVEEMGPNDLLSLQDLSCKLAFLLSCVGIARVSELAVLSYIPLQKLSNAWLLARLNWKKNTDPSTRGNLNLVIPYFNDNPLLCPVSCFEQYLTVTSPWRSAEDNRLFLALKPPHAVVSKDTIARWIKKILVKADIDISHYTAHSVRSAVAAKANLKGFSVDQVMAAADWSSKHNFVRFYKKDIALDLSLSVLQ